MGSSNDELYTYLYAISQLATCLITLIVIPPLTLISIYFQKKILKSYRIVRKTNSKITGAFNEGIMGAKTTKTLVTEEKNLSEFKELTNEMYKSAVMAALLSSVYMPIVITLGSIGTSLALWFGGNKVLSQTISFGTLVAFISYTIQFFEPVKELARVLAEMLSAQASAERVISLIESESEIKDSQEVIKIYGDSFNPKKENWPEIKGNISFKNVTFEYKNGEKVLENFNLDIRLANQLPLLEKQGLEKVL
ncbi:hypothetical protein Q428_14155 [Fervidicella metallireducens AeB]|uniref:ABC transmembrane type-1 domain-containing protein n=1 Tax=Fervidicella metallireducens AeB TaxID=1403537 RepID=A0A017RS33_9CLOT|nr:hypothetical protein Q428_14155 [Fervidicella metallireducens AeB]